MNFKKGLTVVEVVIASAVFAAAVVAISSAYGYFSKIAYRNTASVQATFLAEEGIEAIKILRDYSWDGYINPLSNDTAYRLTWNGTNWGTTTEYALIDSQFDRTFTLSEVYRDASFDVVTSGGSVDTGTRKVVVDVAWYVNGSGTSSKSIEAYISDVFTN